MNIKRFWNWVWAGPVDGPAATFLLRIMAGSVFFWEGILKFVFQNQGVGRFTKLGFPFPGPTAHFVALLEIVGGLLVMSGWLTRPISIVFCFEMLVAILSTKISLYYGRSPLPPPPAPPHSGFWAVLHEVRSEYAQLVVSAFLIKEGPGRLSLDRLLKRQPVEWAPLATEKVRSLDS